MGFGLESGTVRHGIGPGTWRVTTGGGGRQHCAFEVGTAEIALVHGRTPEIGLAGIDALETCPEHIGVLEIGTAYIRTSEIGVSEIAAGEVGAPAVGGAQIGSFEVNAYQIAATELGTNPDDAMRWRQWLIVHRRCPPAGRWRLALLETGEQVVFTRCVEGQAGADDNAVNDVVWRAAAAKAGQEGGGLEHGLVALAGRN